MRSHKAIALWAVAIAYAAAVFVASSLPAPEPLIGPVAVGDKALHALEYGVFALLLALAIGTAGDPRISSRAPWIAFLVAALYGVTDEIHQTFVPGRVGDVVDLAWDVFGAGAGAVVVHLLRARAAHTRAVSETSPR